MVDILKLVFEVEHMLNQALFNDDDISKALASIGITKEMPANKRGLFRDADSVAALQALPDGHPLKQLLQGEDSLSGINRHEGSADGGNQFGKLRFQQEVFGDLVGRLNLPAGDPDKITLTEFKYASFEALKFIDDLTLGKIKDAAGNVMGVMGNSPYAQDLLHRFYGTDPTTGEPNKASKDAKRFSDPSSAADRAALDGFIDKVVARNESLATRTTTVTDSEGRVVKNYTVGNGVFGRKVVENFVEGTRNANIISAEQANNINRSMGTQAEISDQVLENASVVAQTAVFAKEGIGQVGVEEVAQFRGAAAALEKSGDGVTAEETQQTVEAQRKQMAIEKAEIERSGSGTLTEAVGTNAVHTSGRSLNHALDKVGGSPVGDVVEFLNLEYEAFKKGISGGGWGDFASNAVQYGIGAVISAGVLRAGGMAAARIGGAAGSAFFAAGVAAYGVYELFTNGWDLLNRVGADLGLRAAIEKEPIARLGTDLFTNEALDAIIDAVWSGKLGSVPVIQSIQKNYLVDNLDPASPDRLDFSDAFGPHVRNQLFLILNGGRVNAGDGYDELYHYGYGTANGGADNDIVVGINAKVLKKGQSLDPLMDKARADRQAENQRIIAENVIRAANGVMLLEILPDLPPSPKATEDLTLTIDEIGRASCRERV